MNGANSRMNLTPEEMIAAALNEHGFLLQQVVKKKLQGSLGPKGDTQSYWEFVATEYPVTAADGSQTRIDILLHHASVKGLHLCLECKRPHPKFKKWVFFDRESNLMGVNSPVGRVEAMWVPHRRPDGDIRHRLMPLSDMGHVPIFSYYVEAAIKRDGNAGQSVSSTEAIEKSFSQVTKGLSGFMLKCRNGTDTALLSAVPVVVTTAELVEAEFDPKKISVADGMITANDLKLKPMDYCAVNYRADDSLSLQMLTPWERNVGINDLISAQIRTVFIVRATALNHFLTWAGDMLKTVPAPT